MGNRLTEEEQRRQTSPTPYGDIFDEAFPHYLVMGMTAEQYWDGESSLKTAYRKAYRMRIENERRLADQNGWYMGQYIMQAIAAVPLFVAGFNTKGAHIPEYPDKPFLEKAEEEKREKEDQKKQEDQSKLAMAMFQSMVAKLNRNIEKRLQEEGSGQ